MMVQSRRHETAATTGNGYVMAALGMLCIAGGVGMLVARLAVGGVGVVAMAVLLICGGLLLAGMYMLQPNEAAILTLFGQYVGTDRHEGLRWANHAELDQVIGDAGAALRAAKQAGRNCVRAAPVPPKRSPATMGGDRRVPGSP